MDSGAGCVAMIPLHRPSFGIVTALGAPLRGTRVDLARLEARYADAAGLAAVWLPSARAGIAWALRAAGGAELKVIAPAFTCAAVHDAVAVASRDLVFVEPAPGEFLPDAPAMSARATGKYALVLCEVYGHTFDLTALARATASPPAIRIVDMAMAVPHPAIFSRLEEKDFAVISFGAGKSMYAGWGAMGFARQPNLAAAVREIRDAHVGEGNARLTLRRAAGALARTAGNHPLVHSLARAVRERLRARPSTASPRGASSPSCPPPQHEPEWRLPSTGVDRALALWNLEHAAETHAARVMGARRYRECLANVAGLAIPKPSADALSHFTVRVAAARRDGLKAALYAAGVNTITLWAVSPRLNAEDFPETHRCSAEVLNLPLTPWMTGTDIERVCGVVRGCLEK